MPPTIPEIGDRFRELKKQTEQGFYAEITDASMSNDEETLILTLDYPGNGSTGEYRVSVPTYWEQGRELVDFLNNIDVGPNTFEQITNRALPVTRVSGSWEVDTTRLQNKDYDRVSSILLFDITDNTANNNVEFSIDYNVDNTVGDHLELDINDVDTDWADGHFTLPDYSGTFTEYSKGGATGDFEITLQVVDADGNVVESEMKMVTAGA